MFALYLFNSLPISARNSAEPTGIFCASPRPDECMDEDKYFDIFIDCILLPMGSTDTTPQKQRRRLCTLATAAAMMMAATVETTMRGKKRKSRNIFADSHPTSTKRHVYFYRFANHQHQHRRRRRRSGKFRYKFDARKKFFEAGYLAPTTKYITIMRSYLFWTSCSLFDFALHPLGRLQRTDTRQILNIRC